MRAMARCSDSRTPITVRRLREACTALGLVGALGCNAPNRNPFVGEEMEPAPAACTGALVAVLNHAVAPPANVAAQVSVTDCGGKPLAQTLDATNFDLGEDGKVLSAFEAQREI